MAGGCSDTPARTSTWRWGTHGYRGWVVRSRADGGDVYLHSGSAPSHCPAHTRAANNNGEGVKCWRYYNTGYDWIDLPQLDVTCSTHDSISTKQQLQQNKFSENLSPENYFKELCLERDEPSGDFLNGALRITRTAYQGEFRFRGRLAQDKDFDAVVEFLKKEHNMVNLACFYGC